MEGLVGVVDEWRLGRGVVHMEWDMDGESIAEAAAVVAVVAVAAAAALDDSLTSPKIFSKDKQRRAEQSRHRHQPTARESEGCSDKNRAVMDGFGHAHRLHSAAVVRNSTLERI